MPSFPFTPGTLVLSGGEFNPEPIRFSFTPGRLTLSGNASINAGPSLSSGVVADLAAVLDNLFASEAIVDAEGRPTRRLQQIWENTIGAIVRTLTSQGVSLEALENAFAAANAAQATAATAVQTANTTQSEIALSTSYTDPVGVLTAASSGTITVAAHERRYGNGITVNVNGGTVSGFAPGEYVTVYYTDPARAGGAVTYQGTTSAVSQTGNTHIVGQVAIPQVGSPDASGGGPTAPGYTPPDFGTYDPGLIHYGPGG